MPAAATASQPKKGFLEKAFNVKRFLKATPLGPAVVWYERVEDPVGEIKKFVKIAVQDRILFSTLGPYFREHPIYGLTQLMVNAPKKIFDLTREVWNWNATWGFKKHVVPKFTEDQLKKIIYPLAQNRIQESDHLGRLILKDEKGERLKLAYDRRINFWDLFDVPGSQGKGAMKSTAVFTPKAGAGSQRAFGTGVQIFKKGLLGVPLFFINPLLAPLPLLLDDRVLSHLGWEDQAGFYRDKLGLPLLNNQNEYVPGLKVLTEDGREWVLPARNLLPGDIRAKARVFQGRFAPILNKVAGAARGFYVFKSYFSLNPQNLDSFGWARELGEMNFKAGTLPAKIVQRSGRLAQFSRTLFYLHPRNWLNGEAFKKLGFAESLVLNRGQDFLHRAARGIYNFHPATLLGRAAGAVKRWLLAAKKKADDFWKKLLLIPLKLLFDLLMKLLTGIAKWVAGKIAPYLARFGGWLSKLIPPGVKEFFAKAGAGIGESLVGKLMAKIGAQLAGKALLGMSLRFLGNLLFKGAFEAFAWLTAPELQILSYAWKAVSWILQQTVGRLLQAVSSRLVASLASRLGISLAQAGWRMVLGALAQRAWGALLQFAWRPLVGWLAQSAWPWVARLGAQVIWPTVAGFFTTTLPAALAGLATWLGAALAGVSLASVGIVIGIVVVVVVLIFVVAFVVPQLFWNPYKGEPGAPQLVLSKIVKVDPADANGGGTSRIPYLDGGDHLVEFLFLVKNAGSKRATAVSVTDVKLGRTFPESGPAELEPGQEKELGRGGLAVRADSDRVETNEALGTAVVEGETLNFSDVGILLVGNPPTAPPCGWPATGFLRTLFQDDYPLSPGEAKSSGIHIVSVMEDDGSRPSQSVWATVNGVVARMWFDKNWGGVMIIKGLDGTFAVGFIFLTEASVRAAPATGQTKFGLRVGSSVRLGQLVAETYFGPVKNSWDTSLLYTVKLNGDFKDPFDYTPSRPSRLDSVTAGGCW